MIALQTLDRFRWLQHEYERLWTGVWWGANDRLSMERKFDVQLRQFRLAVARGAVTAHQRSYLLSRVDTESSS